MKIVIKELDLRIMAMLEEGGASRIFSKTSLASLSGYITGIK